MSHLHKYCSGVAVVSSIVAALLPCLETEPEMCLWFSGVWFVFLARLHFLLTLAAE